MKMLFFSADGSEVELVNQELASAGIACEVRRRPDAVEAAVVPAAPVEVWLRNDADCHRAATLCVQLGVGYAVQPVKRSARLWIELNNLLTRRS